MSSLKFGSRVKKIHYQSLQQIYVVLRGVYGDDDDDDDGLNQILFWDIIIIV